MVLLPKLKSFGSVVGTQGKKLFPQVLLFLGRRMLRWNEINIAIFCKKKGGVGAEGLACN
jgi:hypothetical protein